MKTTLDLIYNGAWNNLELSKSSKNALFGSGALLGLGVLGFIYIMKRK
jgi:hypothetical protein